MPLNKAWHASHRMPARSTLEQRIHWHMEHARHCGCRSMPQSIAAELKRRQRISAGSAGETAHPAFVIKVEIPDPPASKFNFIAQKTMYGGRHIAAGDAVFLFASENEGGRGLIARGVVTTTESIPKKRGIARQTPRVSITVRRTSLAKRPLGRSELKLFRNWNDGRPETELNFKFYRQAGNKIASISDQAAAFLGEFF